MDPSWYCVDANTYRTSTSTAANQMTGAHSSWLPEHNTKNKGGHIRWIGALGLSCKSNSDTENPCVVNGAGGTNHANWHINLVTTTKKFVSDDTTGNEGLMDYDQFPGTVTTTNGGAKSLMIFTSLKNSAGQTSLYDFAG